MNKNLINSDNWTHCHYASKDLKAVITLGADPELGADQILYFATVIDEQNNEIFQKEFKKLETACAFINKRYQKIWDYIDVTQSQNTQKSGGCSTCIAH